MKMKTIKTLVLVATFATSASIFSAQEPTAGSAGIPAGTATNAASLAQPGTQPETARPPDASTSAAPGDNGANGLRLNFRGVPLERVLDYLSDAAGFVISANSKVDLQGKVTVWSNQLVDRNEAIALLNSALTSSG